MPNRPFLDSDNTLAETYFKTGPYGQFAYTAGNQTSGGTTSENLVAFDTEVAKVRLEHDNVTTNSKITVVNAGVYFISATLIVNASAAGKTFDGWLKKNGSNVANSGIHSSMPNNGDEIITRGWIISLAAGDYIEVAWCSRDDGSMILENNAAGASPTSPAAPCAILTIVRVSL